MKKGVIFLMLLGILFIILVGFKPLIDKITGEIITSEAVSYASLNITLSGPPGLTLDKPKNKTYFSNASLDLEFTATSADNLLYNLDNSPNTTITGNIEFNTSYGSHTLYLYANNSNGITWKNVTFLASSTILTIDKNEFDERKGSTTNFTKYPYDEVQNLSNVTLEDIEYGKIFFNENVNVTDDDDFSDPIVNITANANLSFNRIQINSSVLRGFNKSATLTLYNLTFTDPRILRDGSVCSSAICTEQSYSSGIFVFNVTGFSVYSAEETPATAAPSGTTSPGGGGGGGITFPKIFKKGISISAEDIKVSLKKGQVATEEIVIKNEDTKKLRVNIENPRLKDFVIVREPVFDLNPGESKEVTIDIIARENSAQDLYLGSLFVKTGYEEKQIFVAVEVESGEIMDVRIKIQGEYLKSLPGEEIPVEVSLFNLGTSGRIDALIEYYLKDFDGNEIIIGQETLAVETQLSFVKEMILPLDISYGKHLLYARASYNGEVASSSQTIEIVQFKVTTREKIFIAIIVISIILMAMIIYHAFQQKTEPFKKIKRKIDVGELIKK